MKVSSDYDAAKKALTLKVSQSCPPTPGQPVKKPFHIPFALALLDHEGKETLEKTVSIKANEETFVFDGVLEAPQLSLLRGFSAPVNLKYKYTEDELLFLLAKYKDPFSRWEAGQKLGLREWQKGIDAKLRKTSFAVSEKYLAAIGAVLADEKADQAFLAELISLPEESYMEQLQAVVHPDVIVDSQKELEKTILNAHED